MGKLYVDTGGSANNSGSSDNNAADLSGSAATVSGAVATLDGSPDLSGLQTSGANQSSILLQQATNANMKIFWITAFNNSTKTVTLHASPTGVTSSAWAIGGRHVLTNASIEGAVRAGDIVQFNNSPASAAATRWTFRNAGTSASGMPMIVGKTGVRPVLTSSNSSNVVSMNSLSNCWVENLELQDQGSSLNGIVSFGGGDVVYNVKISDFGESGINDGNGNNFFVGNEITGGGDGSEAGYRGGPPGMLWGNYIHDVTGDGIKIPSANPSFLIAFNVIDTCSGRGIYLSGGATATVNYGIFHNTIYGCGNSGIEAADGDYAPILMGNICQDNGNAAGEYNVEWTTNSYQNVSLGGYNCFYHQGGGGGANLSNYTAQATDVTTDPLFVDAAGGDFRLKPGSPCAGTAFPGTVVGAAAGYLDMGAIQRRLPSSMNINSGGLVACG